MNESNTIEAYVTNLRSRLHLDPEAVERIASETEEHLRDRAAAHAGTVMDQRQAETLAIAEFGPAWRVALRFDVEYLQPLKLLAFAGVILFAVLAFCRGSWQTETALWTFSLLTALAVIDVWLAIGFVLTALFPRGIFRGAVVISIAWVAFSTWMQVSGGRPMASVPAVVIWDGWQSGIYYLLRPPSFTRAFNATAVQFASIPESLLLTIAFTLSGVWASGWFRRKLAGSRGGRATA